MDLVKRSFDVKREDSRSSGDLVGGLLFADRGGNGRDRTEQCIYSRVFLLGTHLRRVCGTTY